VKAAMHRNRVSSSRQQHSVTVNRQTENWLGLRLGLSSCIVKHVHAGSLTGRAAAASSIVQLLHRQPNNWLGVQLTVDKLGVVEWMAFQLTVEKNL
jgi:hypothetical protein